MNRRHFLAAFAASFAFRPQPLISSVFPVRFKKSSPYEDLYPFIDPGGDEFAVEKIAVEIESVLRGILRDEIPPVVAASARSPMPVRFERIADDVSRAVFDFGPSDFEAGWNKWIASLGQVVSSRFYALANHDIRYEITSRAKEGIEYRVGLWKAHWQDGKFESFEPVEEILTRAKEPLFVDVSKAIFGSEESFQKQLLYGVPYWRSRIDSASGIDVYGQNGISAGDIDNDGWDEVYVCQPGGLPNRLYKRRKNGTFEDITDRANVGVLDSTSCALFVDFRNSGWQDLVVLTSAGPLYFLNQKDGTFRHKPEAFRFANRPQGAFTGMSAADYDGDGLVDLYLCTYVYFQSEDQYSYPLPYYDAKTGPPNFLFRNQLTSTGDGFFEDVTASTGLNVNNDRYSFAPAWCDYDGDGHPDLYVANDFGRKNLYKNEGGRFRDVAAETGVEDLGPGMSATWLDYDSDGRPDLYVTNMWSPSGQRLRESEAFPPVARDHLTEEYRRHSKGNSLFRNRGDGTFEETSATEGVEMGRWSWSGDALDFDADGTPEIYVTAGMITNSSERDLMSFFWRQVVAKSPPKLQAASGYEKGWNAINQLIREDYSWNGHEPNVFHARRGSRYYDFSGVSGLDFAADSRAFAATDFDGDGRIDLFLKNRLAPQIRALENHSSGKNHVIVLQLQGTKANRDAIGAWVVVEHEGGKTSQLLQAGCGYLSQHTKRLHFGLGVAQHARKITIRWPGGSSESIENLEAEHLYFIHEGKGVVDRKPLGGKISFPSSRIDGHNETTFEPTWLLEPVPLPEKHPGPGFVCLTSEPAASVPGEIPFRAIRIYQSDPDVAAWYALFRRYLFDYRTGLMLPMLLLIDERSRAHKIYPAVPSEIELRKDLEVMKSPDRAALALPFRGRYYDPPSRNYFRHGAAFFHAGYPRQALGYLEEVVNRNPANFKAQLAIGQIHLELEQYSKARAALEIASKLRSDSPELWNNIGGVEMGEKNYASAAKSFEKALQLEPDLTFALINAGQAYVQLDRTGDAEKMFRRAIEIDPKEAEAANQLGLLLARQDRTTEAKKYFEQAITADRAHTSAINNLAVLYIKTNQRQDAIAALRYGISVAPQTEVLYLNLARIYVQSGDRGRARDALESLLAAKPDSSVARNALRELGVQ